MLLRVCVALVTASVLSAQKGAGPGDWIQLFNGKNLDEWKAKITGHDPGENFGNTFRVENGVLKVSYDQYKDFGGKFGHLFYKDKFSHYIVAVEYRFIGDQATNGPTWALRNSGIMLHGQSPESMKREQDFPISIEVQLLGGNGTAKRTTANLCTPGTNVVREGKLFTPHCLNSTSKTYHGEQWVRVEVKVLGSEHVEHIVEGEVVMAYDQPQIGGGAVTNFDPEMKKDGTLLEEGTISLQSESHPVEFRKVELLNLRGCMDAKAKNYRSHFVKDDKAGCRY